MDEPDDAVAVEGGQARSGAAETRRRVRRQSDRGAVVEQFSRPAFSLPDPGVRLSRIALCEAGDGQCADQTDVIEYLEADTFVVVDYGLLRALRVRVIWRTFRGTMSICADGRADQSSRRQLPSR